MALQITETRGMFSVHGVLNSGNASILNRHMRMFINPQQPVVLNLEKVRDMDKSAAFALQQLYVGAMRTNSVLSIIGIENKNIIPVLNETRTSYIFNHDRV